MLFSIIIPMYNSELFIGSCLDSILGQGIDPELYEIIIVNDGSRDNSCDIVEKYAMLHPNVKLFSQTNKGQSAARNYGITKASGDFIQFVDSDDLLIPNSLCQIVSFVLVDKTVGSTDIITFGITEGSSTRYNLVKNDGSGQCVYRGNGYDYIGSHNYNNGPWYYWLNSKFVKLHNLRFEEGKLCEDGMFTLTALLNAKSISRIDSTVYYYVDRPNSTVNTKDLQKIKRLIDGFEYAIDYFNKTIDAHKDMGEPCFGRVINRRDSYAFFLLIRLFRLGEYAKAKAVTSRLKSMDVYPLRYFPGKDYPSAKIGCITKIINLRPLYLALCKVKSLL